MTERTMDVRERIVRAAADLLARGGREAVSTRAVSAAAGVQAPTIYRQFGDMRGLLDAVARETFAEYVRQKATRERADDPIEDLRRGWDLHVAFGLANPAVYALIYSDPTSAANAPVVRDGEAILHGLVARAAEAGRLRVSVPHAARMIAAAGSGVTLSLIATPTEDRDPRLSGAMRDAVLAAITVAPTSDGVPDEAPGAGRVAARAVALRAVLAEAPDALSPAERHLLGEWLDRLAGAGG
ncbi:TetR/AcrR family transcriptional regulator [Sorangium sp. So ce1128]